MAEEASSTPAKAPMQAPLTPWSNPALSRPGAGTAGASLRAEARRVRDLQRVERGRLWRSSPRLAAVVGCVTVAALAWFAATGGGLVLWVLTVLYGAVVAEHIRRLVAVQRANTTVRDLVREAVMEEQVGAVLDRLAAHGWTVLHDRLLCGTGHRLAHVAVGPAGVVLVRPLRIKGPVVVDGGSLMVGGLPYDAWTDTRVWEAAQLAHGAAAMLPGGWTVLATQHAVAIGGAFPADLRSWNRVGLCSTSDINHVLLSAPATLHREAAAFLASVVSELCPPAPSD